MSRQKKVAADVLLQISKQTRKAVEMREAWSAIARARPDDAAAANAVIYHGLVMGIAPPPTLAERAGANPSDIGPLHHPRVCLAQGGQERRGRGDFPGHVAAVGPNHAGAEGRRYQRARREWPSGSSRGDGSDAGRIRAHHAGGEDGRRVPRALNRAGLRRRTHRLALVQAAGLKSGRGRFGG
jgi:hypothetical protein